VELAIPTLMQNIPAFESGSIVRIGLNYPIMDKGEKDRGWRKELSEQELKRMVQKCREGDPRAMEALYENFKTSLFNLALRYTYNYAAAEDVIQDVFIKVFTNLHTLDDDKAFVGWLYRIAVNTCFSYLRSHKKFRQRTIPLEDIQGVYADSGPSETERAENRFLEESIQILPPRLKSVFLLHDVQGFKHLEVAQILRCSVGTSKSQLFKARKKIRKYLEIKRYM
jgi:RNA polymerase sigma-70 factor (ECF subfamily)